MGSAGSLLPGFEARIVTLDGTEVTEYGKPGELWLQSPSNVLGYLANDKETEATFVADPKGGRWLRTGDVVMVRKSPKGYEHYWIVDRIKEMMKVKVSKRTTPFLQLTEMSLITSRPKGHQVAPAELESYLLDHPAVSDCGVIGVPDQLAGELPKAVIVINSEVVAPETSASAIAETLVEYVKKGKARHKWLSGGLEIVDAIPKSPTGKILRKELKAREKARHEAIRAKL